ncbi:MAG: protein kinase, partial [Nocardioides sp.]|uniref:protein kinase domain-containing protein n=1 Tax=Nocardioides sp. TaxID=35761 RepID=UPI003F0B8B8E
MSAPVIPGFTFVEHLGSGGFADVFLYEQQWPRQRVAIKVVRPDVPLTEREKQLFTAEANAMARLADHPYIVSVITAGMTQDGGRPYLVMRYCPPPDL